MAKVKTVLIGYGHLGKWHAQKCESLDSCDFQYIVEPFAEAQKRAQSEFPNVKVVSSLSDIETKIDAAIIVTPTSLHYDLVKECIKKKWHCFCEKPLCETSTQAQELFGLAQESGLIFQVGHSERFHEAWEIIADSPVLKSKEKIIRINRIAAFKGRATDVDVVQDLMVHDLDMLLYVLNEKPISVDARGLKIRTKHWDHVQARFELESGGIAEITVGRNYVHEQRSMDVVSEAGCLYVDLFKNEIHEAPHDQIEDGVFTKMKTYQKRDHLLQEQKMFYSAIINGSSIPVTIDHGVKVVELISCVHNSLEQGKVINI